MQADSLPAKHTHVFKPPCSFITHPQCLRAWTAQATQLQSLHLWSHSFNVSHVWKPFETHALVLEIVLSQQVSFIPN